MNFDRPNPQNSFTRNANTLKNIPGTNPLGFQFGLDPNRKSAPSQLSNTDHFMPAVRRNNLDYNNQKPIPEVIMPKTLNATGRPDSDVANKAAFIINNYFSKTQKLSKDVKKVMIRNISDQIPDMLLVKMLRECGEIVSFKRLNNDISTFEEGSSLSTTGVAEFKEVEGIIRCTRLLHGMKVFGHPMEIKTFDQTNMLIRNFYEYKKAEMRNPAPGIQLSEREVDVEMSKN